MVGVVVEEVPHFLIRQQDAAAGGQGDAVGVLPRDPPSAIQRQHCACRIRAAGRQRLDLRLGHHIRAEQGIGEGLAQSNLKLSFLGAGQLTQIDAEGFAQFDQ